MQPHKPIPRKALPSKPLPNKPLPGTLPPQKPQPQPNQPQPQQQQQYSANPPQQVQAQPQHFEPKNVNPIPQQNILQNNMSNYSEPSVSDTQSPAMPTNYSTEMPTTNNDQQPEPAPNNNWYKGPVKAKNSFKAKANKTCKLLLDDKKNKMKKVKLFQTFDHFFVAEGDSKNRGFRVASICNNEFGNAFAKTGVESGWAVVKIGNNPLENLRFALLKNQIFAAGQKAGDKGYYLMFDGNPQESKDNEADIESGAVVTGNGRRRSSVSAPVSLGKNSVELVEGFSGYKTVRIKHPIEKYIDFAAVSGAKGYKIAAFKDKFGVDLQQFGIALDWKVVKIGDKDVSNLFTQMIKTNLDVQWQSNQSTGFVVTFAAPS